MKEYFKLGNYCSIFHIYHSGVGSQQCFTSLQLRQFNLIPTVQLFSNTHRAEGVRPPTLLPICMDHQLQKKTKNELPTPSEHKYKKYISFIQGVKELCIKV